jgi:hypothetical protein
MGYCSDSRGGWYHGHPLDHPSVAQGRALQLLTHPVWWTLPAGEATAKLKRFLLERYQLLDEELASQCQIHHSGNLRRLLLL